MLRYAIISCLHIPFVQFPFQSEIFEFDLTGSSKLQILYILGQVEIPRKTLLITQAREMDHDVFQFQVLVNYSFRMHISNAPNNLQKQIDGVLFFQKAAFSVKQVLQSTPVALLHDDVLVFFLLYQRLHSNYVWRSQHRQELEITLQIHLFLFSLQLVFVNLCDSVCLNLVIFVVPEINLTKLTLLEYLICDHHLQWLCIGLLSNLNYAKLSKLIH